MKYTGWAVLVLGVLVGLYGLFIAMPSGGPAAIPVGTEATPAVLPFPLGTALLGFSAVAVAAGIAMLVFGGRGVIKTKNLTVRN